MQCKHGGSKRWGFTLKGQAWPLRQDCSLPSSRAMPMRFSAAARRHPRALPTWAPHAAAGACAWAWGHPQSRQPPCRGAHARGWGDGPAGRCAAHARGCCCAACAWDCQCARGTGCGGAAAGCRAAHAKGWSGVPAGHCLARGRSCRGDSGRAEPQCAASQPGAGCQYLRPAAAWAVGCLCRLTSRGRRCSCPGAKGRDPQTGAPAPRLLQCPCARGDPSLPSCPSTFPPCRSRLCSSRGCYRPSGRPYWKTSKLHDTLRLLKPAQQPAAWPRLGGCWWALYERRIWSPAAAQSSSHKSKPAGCASACPDTPVVGLGLVAVGQVGVLGPAEVEGVVEQWACSLLNALKL